MGILFDEDPQEEPQEEEREALCEICGAQSAQMLIEDLAVCKKCEAHARHIVWLRRYQ